MAIVVEKNLWLNAVKATALMTVDDYCPLDQGIEHDYGGNMTPTGLVQSFFIDRLIKKYPACRINWFTIPNMRQDLKNTPNIMFPDGTYQLRNHPAWVSWTKDLQKNYPQIAISYHGWMHTIATNPENAGEFNGYDAAQTIEALTKMKEEFDYVGIKADKAFRSPGWAYNQTLFDWLADNDIVYCDNKSIITSDNEFLPSYYTTNSGKKLVRIPVPSTAMRPIIDTYEGNGIFHFHWTQPNSNRLSLKSNQDTADLIFNDTFSRYGNDVAWLTYQEMGEHFKRSHAVVYETSVVGATLTIQTQNTPEELKGVTFEFPKDKPLTVKVLDKFGGLVSGLRITFNNRDCFVCGESRLPVYGVGRKRVASI